MRRIVKENRVSVPENGVSAIEKPKISYLGNKHKKPLVRTLCSSHYVCGVCNIYINVTVLELNCIVAYDQEIKAASLISCSSSIVAVWH